ncbi:MAG: hypothetical protein WBM46_09460 [Polyangiales bacterium]
MRPFSAWLLISTLLGLAALSSRASAQETIETPIETAEDGSTTADIEIIEEEIDASATDALAFNAELLDGLLELSTEQTIREKKYAAAAGITGGSILIGLGIWRLVENEPQSDYSRGLGVMFLTLGMADLTTGVFAATRIPHERRRLARWEKARSNGITELELAHFEGELQASDEMRQGERLLVRWDALTHALAGVIVLAITPIPGSSGRADRVSGYVIGGLFVGIGLATFGNSFRKTPSEKAWESYKKGNMPMPGHEISWGIAPAVSRRGAGVSIGGRF